MKENFKHYLFQKHILVNDYTDQGKDTPDGSAQHFFEIRFALAGLFGIRIISGEKNLSEGMIRFVSMELGEDVPEPFYTGFPESVRELSSDELLFDQLLHYARTYGSGDFSEAGHSVLEPVSDNNESKTESESKAVSEMGLEEAFRCAALKPDADTKDFAAVSEEEAVALLAGMVQDLLAGTRPLSEEQFRLVKSGIEEYDFPAENIASKDTAVRLLLAFRDLRYAEPLVLSDVLRFVDELLVREYSFLEGEWSIDGKTLRDKGELRSDYLRLRYLSDEGVRRYYGDRSREEVQRWMEKRLMSNADLRHLNLKNKDRKFITGLMDSLFDRGRVDLRTCFEKKKEWNGLLHHIHYSAKTPEAEAFLSAMRGKTNESVFAEFEAAMKQRQLTKAAEILKEGKGTGALLRNLNYIISRCETQEEMDHVLSLLDTGNVILLLQLLMQYGKEPRGGARSFAFVRHNEMKVHKETEEEMEHRKSQLSIGQTKQLERKIREQLGTLLVGRLGKVYIDPAMKNYALPLQEGATQGGFGVLPKGSRVSMKEAAKGKPILRAFTYWEKVNDIDLSCFGLGEKGARMEFSWRTMHSCQSEAITYSGDQTSGYKGGSEYFDIDLAAFRETFPGMRYIIFCDNVFSGITFDRVTCRAGFMFRDPEDKGEIYEPKTVKSAFTINCNSTFSYLFGLDLETMDLLWLNLARDSSERVAGNTDMSFLLDYFHTTEIMNVYSFFEMMATELTSDPGEAEVIVTDKTVEAREDQEVIHEYDFEKMIALMNRKS